MTNKIKIAHLITSLDSGGAEKMLCNLVVNMDDARFENIVISMKDLGFWGNKLRENGIDVYCLEMKNLGGLINTLIILHKILKSYNPDILQTWLQHANVLGALVSLFLKRTKLLWNIRCSYVDMKNYKFSSRLALKLSSLLSRAAHKIIVNSKAGIFDHEKIGFVKDRWGYIPNGFDTSLFKPSVDYKSKLRQKLNILPDSKLIGLIGRYDPMKDHETFIKACSIYLQEYKGVNKDSKNLSEVDKNYEESIDLDNNINYEFDDKTVETYFVLAGRGVDDSNKELGALIKSLNLQDRVFLLGEIKNIPEIVSALDILSLTSLFGEGFPNVIGEAMSCGVMCVATDVGDSKYIIDDTGIIVAKKSPDELASAWNKLIDLSMEQQVNLSKKARNRIIENFSLRKIIGLYEEQYQSVLS